jgi:hypothetical protein
MKALAAGIMVIVWGVLPVLFGCGPKPDADEPSKKHAAGGKKTGKSKVEDAVTSLNEAIGRGDDAALEALVVDYTLELLQDTVTFAPAEKGGGISSPSAADFIEYAKQNGIEYVYKGYDEDNGAEMIEAVENGEVVAAGPVALVEKERGPMLDFQDVAQAQLEKVQSEGIQRGKYVDVIDRINAAVEKGNGLELKKLITIDTLNLELKVRSYEVKHKKNLSLQYIADSWKNDGVLFEVSEVDIDAQTAQMKLAAGDDVIYEGKVDFVTEVGQLKLDFTEILKAKLAELEESQGSKGKKKKKGK